MFSWAKQICGMMVLMATGLQYGFAAEVKFGFLGGVTGPAASVVAPIRDGAHLALMQINRQGGILDNRNAILVVRDTGCMGETKPVNAAEALVKEEHVSAVIGAVCSSATLNAAKTVTIPAGVVMISPASTAREISSLKDEDLVFRTAPSDALTAEMLAILAKEDGEGGVVIAHPDNAFGRTMLAAFLETMPQPAGTYAYPGQEGTKGAFRKNLAELAENGGKRLAVISYFGGAGNAILSSAGQTKLYERYYATQDATDGNKLDRFDGSLVALQPARPVHPGSFRFKRAAKSAGFDGTAQFSANAYDAAFILALAIQRAGTSDPTGLGVHVRAVASAPGELILPGQWEKAVTLLGEGRDINYEGAAGSQEFDEQGDVSGSFVKSIVEDGVLKMVGKVE